MDIARPSNARSKRIRQIAYAGVGLMVVLLITLLYGIITYGLILAAQSTITQAAADGPPVEVL